MFNKIIEGLKKFDSDVKDSLNGAVGLKGIKITSREIADRQIQLIENNYEPRIDVHLEAIEVLRDKMNAEITIIENRLIQESWTHQRGKHIL